MNRGYAYGKSSNKVISTVNPLLKLICAKAIEIANTRKLHCPDFGISRGKSTAEQQFTLYKQGRTFCKISKEYTVTGKVITNCDGHYAVSSHQSGNAVDFFAIIHGRANYEPEYIALVATCFFEAASDLGVDCDWGGSFKSISDGAHFEIIP